MLPMRKLGRQGLEVSMIGTAQADFSSLTARQA